MVEINRIHIREWGRERGLETLARSILSASNGLRSCYSIVMIFARACLGSTNIQLSVDQVHAPPTIDSGGPFFLARCLKVQNRNILLGRA